MAGGFTEAAHETWAFIRTVTNIAAREASTLTSVGLGFRLRHLLRLLPIFLALALDRLGLQQSLASLVQGPMFRTSRIYDASPLQPTVAQVVQDTYLEGTFFAKWSAK